MIVNEALDFTSAPENVKTAFLRVPEKVRLNAGTQLYRWTDQLLGPSDPVTVVVLR